MTALTFGIASLSTGAGLGYGMICFEARYASVAWFGADRLDRRVVMRSEWRMLELALQVGIPDTPLQSTHVVPWILVAADRRASVLVQRVADLRVAVEHARVAETLDGWLRDLAAKTDEALSSRT